MDVIYVATDNFSLLAGVSIQSLLEHSTWADRANVNLVNIEISSENLHKIKSIVKKFSNAKLKLWPAKKWIQKIVNSGSKTYKGNFAAYLRLFAFSEIPAESELLLYIDADTLVLNSLKELFSKSPSRAFSIPEHDHPRQTYLTKITEHQFPDWNSGIMLANQTQLKSIDYDLRLQEALTFSWANDQEILAYAFKNDITRLHYSYNVLPNIFFVNPKLYQKLSGYNNHPAGEQIFQVACGQVPVRIIQLFPLGGHLPQQALEGNYHPFAKAWHDTLAKTDFADDYVPPPVPHTLEATLKKRLPKTLVILILPFFWGRSHRQYQKALKHVDAEEIARAKRIRERYGLPIPDRYPNV